MIYRLLLVGMLVSSLAFAQRGGGGGRGGGGEISGMPGAVGTTRIDIIAQMLQLRKEQKKDVKATLDSAQKEALPVRDQLLKGHLAIGEAVQTGKSPEEIKKLIDAHAAQQFLMAEIEAKAFAKIYQGLDESQQGNSRALFQMMKGIFIEKNWNAVE
jgi:hypothetical protein